MTPLEAKLAQLAQRFADRAADERAALAAAIAADDRAAVAGRAHKLAGIAAMLGQAPVGEAAFALEAAAERGGSYATEAKALIALLDAL